MLMMLNLRFPRRIHSMVSVTYNCKQKRCRGNKRCHQTWPILIINALAMIVFMPSSDKQHCAKVHAYCSRPTGISILEKNHQRTRTTSPLFENFKKAKPIHRYNPTQTQFRTLRRVKYDDICRKIESRTLHGTSVDDILSQLEMLQNDTSVQQSNLEENDSNLLSLLDRNAILNHKLQGLHLSDQKLLVLQDAAKRMLQRHQNKMKEQQQYATKTTIDAVEQAHLIHQKEIESYTKLMEKRIQQIEMERTTVSNELKLTKIQYKKRIDEIRTSMERQIDEVQQRYDQDYTKWMRLEKDLYDQIDSLKANTATILYDTNSTIHTLQMKLQQHDYELQECEQYWKTKYKRLKQQYNDTVIQINMLQNQLNNVHVLQQEQANLNQKLEQYQEQMEIANAAVSAANHREDSLRQQCTQLQQTNIDLQESITKLQEQLRIQNVRYKELQDVSLAAVSQQQKEKQSFTKYTAIVNIVRRVGRWVKYIFIPRIVYSSKTQKH